MDIISMGNKVGLTRDEMIKLIIEENSLQHTEQIQRALEEAFRCGFLRGEDYGKSC